ncbi:MAG: hypothetical protein ROZ36_19370 [Thermincola sp.]|jgi:nitrous-oxide reductase|nr:hypothetical protein [Thermincola sp.]
MSRKKIRLLAFLLLGVFLGGVIAYSMIPGPAEGEVKPLVAPGEKDEYYAFLSGGKGGDVRVFGVPSMRLIRVIPVFNPSAQYGYARTTDGTRKLLDDSGGARWGNTLFPVLSKTAGDYDGHSLFIQDEAHGRVAKVSLKTFESEVVAKLPNMNTAQALAVDPNTKYLIVGGQYAGEAKNGTGVISFTDPEKLEVGFQVTGPEVAMLDGGKDGSKVFGAVPQLPGQKDGGVVIFDIKALENAVSAMPRNTGQIPVLDGAQVKDAVTVIPVQGKITEVSVSPDGKYVAAGGEGSKTTLIDTATMEIAAQPDLGQDPRYTVFDGSGNAYTAIYSESKVVKWNIERAISDKGDSSKYVLESMEVNANPVFLELGDGRTSKPTGKWLLVYNQKGQDRFLDVKFDVQNTQIVDISGEKMELVMDSPVEPEITDGVSVQAAKLQPYDIFPKTDETLPEGKDRIERDGNNIHVFMTAKRTDYGFPEIHVKKGDHVYLHVTNIEKTKDIIHGFTLTQYNVNLELPPGKTVTTDFIADKPGVHWYYCTIFCSALHLEMTGRLIVEP